MQSPHAALCATHCLSVERRPSRPPMTGREDGLHPKGDGGLSAEVAGRRPRRAVHFRGSRGQGTPSGVRCPSTDLFVGERQFPGPGLRSGKWAARGASMEGRSNEVRAQ